ncbi:BRO family protein [uncultured Campylobacter sp.]|mgnify:CR=1 FL=1|uniref:BRO-N domain-containing protein n=1 Tax=uncultured Campylobacter sp. TaxID=218934 RepID=UPI0026059643|nr:BRO family protein [uncultured Campylobacter sp.]
MNLEIFKNENFEIRVAVDETGEPLFCLADVCKILELANPTHAVNAIKSEFELPTLNVGSFDTGYGVKEFTMITEPQLYFVLMRSDKPNAKPFRMWVNKEVLPSIRKTGSYTQNFIPQDLPTALRAYANEVEQKQLALKQRDYALATKAWIGSKREATAMATASAAKREADKLRIKLDQSKEYATIKKVAGNMKTSEKNYNFYFLRDVSEELGKDRPFCEDKNYPRGLRAYHKDVWLKAYNIDITKFEAGE